MIEFYNKYINIRWKNQGYVSKIYFLDINRDYNSVKRHDWIYAQFNNPYSCHSGFYERTTFFDRVKLHYLAQKEEDRVYPKYIQNLHSTPCYFANIKIIEDDINPELEGKVMLFKLSETMFKNILDNFQFDHVYKFTASTSSFAANVKYKFSPLVEKIPVKTITDKEIPVNFSHRNFSEEFYNSLVNRKSLNDKLKKIKAI